ncbi:MAG: hypothetical protein K9W44_04850 [Candidatus Lokiarchaeota archaeon]|nr:hypothetical protein [Candidatus Harpocratesius repetitus]
MKAYLIPTIYGFVAFNEQNDPITIGLHDLPIVDLSNSYKLLSSGSIPDQFQKYLNELQEKGVSTIITEHPVLKKSIDQTKQFQCEIITDDELFRKLYENLRAIFSQYRLSTASNKLRERVKVLSEFIIRNQISQTATQKDFLVKQAVDTIIELDKTVNFLSNRLREWYGLHFPELTDKLIDDNHKFALFIDNIGSRNQCTSEKLKSVFSTSDAKIEELVLKAKRSMGGNLVDSDFNPIQQLAKQIISVSEYRKQLEQYISDTLDEIAPNLKAVLGSQITGKMIASAGSLEHLAHISSSTLQMLGAEKALFKAMRSGGKTPKYGILFQWNKIRTEKSYLRGKIARMVAGKISILAKVDYYKGEFIGENIKEQIDKKIKLIQKQFPRPPKKKKESHPKRSPSRGKQSFHKKGRKNKNQYHRSRQKSYDKAKRRYN